MENNLLIDIHFQFKHFKMFSSLHGLLLPFICVNYDYSYILFTDDNSSKIGKSNQFRLLQSIVCKVMKKLIIKGVLVAH